MSESIAIVGMACRFPGARSAKELWEVALGQRREFRRIPAERLRLDDYQSAGGDSPDSLYCTEAALLEGWKFDRVRFRVSEREFLSSDPAHWLALDVASRALADAGFEGGEGLPRETTGVLVGNSLTGEVSRTANLRLRWPYVRRQVAAALIGEEWSRERRGAFLARLERAYKEPFAPPTEESLSGVLSNTIAGRICNHFDLHGGGYTVDGACASSLLAVAQACSALEAGELDVALAGGVDLSLDPFELVGFARMGALARSEMRVYDRRPTGFLPGEGCGFVVLMRHRDAELAGRRSRASIRGWGISSDGGGGLTRPEAAGQLLALRRAYRRAGFGIDTVSLFEGHGTGTEVGDATELEVLNRARREATTPGDRAPAALGSIKANIGHTKAAAGVAGLIKATMALDRGLLPPITGCRDPHPELTGKDTTLRVLRRPEPWPGDRPPRAGVSAMGFGGINAHLALAGEAHGLPASADQVEGGRRLVGPQDAELLLLAADSKEELRAEVERLRTAAAGLSRAELTDLATGLARTAGKAGPWRAALVSGEPTELAAQLAALGALLAAGGPPAGGEEGLFDLSGGLFLGRTGGGTRVGLLFPGQGSPFSRDGGIWSQRFPSVDAVYSRLKIPPDADSLDTRFAQPALAAASLAATEVLGGLGVVAQVAVGHSLGELSALSWAGAIEALAALRLAEARGAAMSELGGEGGAMAALGASGKEVAELLQSLTDGSPVVAGYNSHRQTVISGPRPWVERAEAAARSRGWEVTRLGVSHAFHSPEVGAVASAFGVALGAESLVLREDGRRRVCSTVTGEWLSTEDDLRSLLVRQVISPVRFLPALERASREVDLFLEVGSGRVLTDLARDSVDVPVVPLESGGASLRGLLRALGALFVKGAPVRAEDLFEDRLTREIDLERPRSFLSNPCEAAPSSDEVPSAEVPSAEASSEERAIRETTTGPGEAASAELPPLDLLRHLISRRTELPPEVLTADSHLLRDLNLSSIAVGELLAQAGAVYSLATPPAATGFVDGTLGELARALEALRETGRARSPGETTETRFPAGVDSWVRAFTVVPVERVLAARERPAGPGTKPRPWRVFAPPDHPLGPALETAFATEGDPRGGVAVWVPGDRAERHVELLLAACGAALEAAEAAPFVLVHEGGGGGPVARSLHLEAPDIPVTVVGLPADAHRAPAVWSRRVVEEARANESFTEARYDAAGRRYQPVLRLLAAEDDAVAPVAGLGPTDVLMATGGGKGIASECALALARASGARLAIVGRAAPDRDDELRANLQRFNSFGVEVVYRAVDVSDHEALREAVGELESRLGPITAVLHGAGINIPRRLPHLNRFRVEQTLAPKVAGLWNLLHTLDTGRLKLLVGFGSVIARSGMIGEADYGLANERLRRDIERFARSSPSCRCLCIEWSVWSALGMGARLNRLSALAGIGVSAISPERGVTALLELLARPTPISVVVAGRLGELPTLEIERPALPRLRFLERPRIHVPGVELVVDSEVSTESDPYLEDHVLDGDRLLPGVIGLEAMAQACAAVTGRSEVPVFRRVRFARPIVVPAGEPVTLRVAALVRSGGEVDLVLRTSRTAFATDDLRATGDYGTRRSPREPIGTGSELPPSAVDPSSDLYGGVLFQGGRFQRVLRYLRLGSTGCVAEVAAGGTEGWFTPPLPAELQLGDPGARDACLHAAQACVPHMPVLPAGIERLTLERRTDASSLLVSIRERRHEGRDPTHDLEIREPQGRLVEHWEGLELRPVAAVEEPPSLAHTLWPPYLERRLGDLLGADEMSVAVERADGGDRRQRSDRALRRLLGDEATVHRRPDGRPETTDGRFVSVAHSLDLTLAVVSHSPVGCDLEVVESRPAELWRDLLGRPRLLAVAEGEYGEDRDGAATRIWTMLECLKKVGLPSDAPIVLERVADDGWMLFASGRHLAATLLVTAAGDDRRFAIAVLAGRGAG